MLCRTFDSYDVLLTLTWSRSDLFESACVFILIKKYKRLNHGFKGKVYGNWYQFNWTYLSICMNLATSLVSRSPILILVFSRLSKTNFKTSLRLPKVSEWDWKISSRLNGHSMRVVVTPDWIVYVYWMEDESPEAPWADAFIAFAAAKNAAIFLYITTVN